MIRPSARSAALVAVLVASVIACGGDGSDAGPSSDQALVPLPAGTLEKIRGPWGPTPFAIDPALLARADQACRTSMAPFPPADLVVADARGGGGIQMQYSGPGGADATCMDVQLLADGTAVASGGGSTGIGGQALPALGPNAIEIRTQMGRGSREDPTSSLVGCRAGAGIAAVAVQIPGRGPIRASLSNGWCLAWIPEGWPPGTRLVGMDAAGTVVARSEAF